MKPLQYETLLKLQDIKNAISQESPEEVELHLNGLEKSLDPYEYQYLLKLINIKKAIDDSATDSGKFPASWPVSGTLEELIVAIEEDGTATTGKSYCGTVHLSDLPESMSQGELRIDVTEDDETLGKVLVLTLTSNNTSPYHWEYTSAYGADGVWHSFATSPIVPGTAGQVLALDAQGNPIWVDAATGGIYDAVIDPNSTNAPQSAAVAAELSQLGQQVIYDVTKNNSTAGPNNDGKFESLSALLSDANLSTLIPIAIRCGGMSIRFVQTSDNKYVQFRLMSDTFSTTESDWQGVDDGPTAGSDNLSVSGGIYNAISEETNYQGEELQIARTIENAKLLDDPNNLFTTNSTTNVLFFKVGANKGYVVSGTCSIDACQISLCSGIGATTFAPWQSVKNGSGSYKVYGKTNQTQQYIAITVDKNSTYSIKPTKSVLDVLTEEIGRAKHKDDSLSEDVRNIYNDLFKNKVSLQSARILTDMKINANLSSTILLSASTTTDVVIFQVGANVLFNVIANSDIVDSAIALTAGTSSSDFDTNKKILVDSNYNYFGKTTQEMQYVAITVKKETSYYCYKKVSVEREIISISTTDTEVQILTKMLAAYNLGECDVVFEHGVYTFDDVYLYMRDTLGWTWTMELPIGNNCRYYFNNSTLISNAPSETFIDSRNILGCKAGTSGKMSYELYDGILINNGGTYCVHDECSRSSNPYTHKYINMRMEYNMGDATESLSKCIGGGCGTKGFIIISDCIFINNNTSGSEDVSYHGLTGSETPISMNFFVSNSWFNHSFGVRSDLKATDDIVVKYSNCSQGSNDTVDTTYCTLYKFNIETRS